MPKLEIIENGTSLNPDTMGDPIYQIGTKNADGGYDIVVFDAMTDKEAKAKLEELQPVKAAPEEKTIPKKKAVKRAYKKDATKKKAKKKAKKKKASTKKKKRR